MNEWTRGDIIAAIGLVVAVVSCVAAILAIPSLRRLVGLGGKDLSFNPTLASEHFIIKLGGFCYVV